MIYYSPDMFELTFLDETLKPIYMQKETIEFKLKQFQTNFDSFKRINYESLLIYERKKNQNPNIIPDKIVLQQLKAIEDDIAVIEFKQTIDKLNRELKNINTTINNEYKKINDMFEFKEKNLQRYLVELNQFFNGGLTFNELMEDIFNNEFNNKKLYYELAAQRIYDVLFLIVSKAPQEWQHTMKLIFDQMHSEFVKEEIKIIEEFKCDYKKTMIIIRNNYALNYGLE